MTNEAREFAEHYGGIWSEHHQYLLVDWHREVADDNTRASYWDWVMAQLDLQEEQ